MSTNEIIILCLIVAVVAGVIAFHVGGEMTLRAIRRGMKWELTQAEAADPTLGPIGAWFAPALGRTLPPVIWRGALDDGPGLDELAPASTARCNPQASTE